MTDGGLRARLEAKKGRRLDVSVRISDPSADQEALLQITAALGLARQREDAATVETLEAEQSQAQARVEAHYVRVPLRSLSSDDWEAATAEYQGENGMDWDRALAPLLAVSCPDPELRDEAWWAAQLKSQEWSAGEVNGLRAALHHLNTEPPDLLVPKD